ncbi:MAG: peptide deformylase [Promethearchaeota archaeon]
MEYGEDIPSSQNYRTQEPQEKENETHDDTHVYEGMDDPESKTSEWSRFWKKCCSGLVFRNLTSVQKNEITLFVFVAMGVFCAMVWGIVFPPEDYHHSKITHTKDILPTLVSDVGCDIPDWFFLHEIESDAMFRKSLLQQKSEPWCAPASPSKSLFQKKRLADLIQHMHETLESKPNEFGLAAIHVGSPIQIIVFRRLSTPSTSSSSSFSSFFFKPKPKIETMINPVLVPNSDLDQELISSKEQTTLNPGRKAVFQRYKEIEVFFKGNLFEDRTLQFSDPESRGIQSLIHSFEDPGLLNTL